MKRLGMSLLLASFALLPVLRSAGAAPHAKYAASNAFSGLAQRDDGGDRDRYPQGGDDRGRDNQDRDRRDVRHDLRIDRAVYGNGNRTVDVTGQVRAQMRDGRLYFPVQNDTLGGDPARNRPKALTVWYTLDGRPAQVTVNENDFVQLPGDAFADNRGDRNDQGDRDRDRPEVRHELRITRALYGTDRKSVDVTYQLNSQIRDGRLNIPVQNQTMGGDPAHNKPKALTVWYTFDGRPGQVTVNETGFLQLPQANAGGDRRDDRDDHGHDYDQAHVEHVVVPPGTQIAVRTDERIDSRDVVEGQAFRAEIAEDVRDADGYVAIPQGSDARLITRRLEGNGDITLDVQSVWVGGMRYRVSTEDAELENHKDGVGANKRTGEFVGGGAAFGAIIGAIAGGGRGAAIGAVVGAGAGAGTQIVTQGREVHVPAESVIRFRLDRPLHLHLWQ
jgi:hypothetical protein